MTTNRFVAAALTAGSLCFGAVAQASADVNATTLVTQAKLAEARGDLQGAVALLEQARDRAAPAERGPVDAALDQLRSRTGGAPAPQDPRPTADQGKDPLTRLVETLDLGSRSNVQVSGALTELGNLGVLAVPTILRKLPELGPFGLRNALALLEEYGHAGALEPLARLVDDGSPSVVFAVADSLDKLPKDLALPLARRIADGEYAPKIRAETLAVLDRHGDDDDALFATAMALAPERETHVALMDLASDHDDERGNALLRALVQHGDSERQDRARVMLLLRADELTQSEAVARLNELPEAWRRGPAIELVKGNPAWVDVAVLGLSPDSRGKYTIHNWMDGVQWWRQPETSLRALLQLPNDLMGQSHVRSAIDQVLATDWRVPADLMPALEARCAGLGYQRLVAAIPNGDEAAALTAWERLGPEARIEFVSYAIRAARPWHRVVLRHLGWMDTLGPLDIYSTFQRSWAGLDEAGTKEFADVVARLQRRWPAPVGYNAGGATMNQVMPWWSSLCHAYQSGSQVPTAAILPLVEAGNREAWRALVASDPSAALEIARSRSTDELAAIASDVLKAARASSSHDDLDLVLRTHDALARSGGDLDSTIFGYLQNHGRGVVSVIALGARPCEHGRKFEQFDAGLARQAAEGADVADLDALLELAPRLEAEVAGALASALRPQLTPPHAPALLTALNAAIDALFDTKAREEAQRLGRVSPLALCDRYLGALVDLGAAKATAAAQRLIDGAATPDKLRYDAARALLTLARDDRQEVLTTMLGYDEALVVGVALEAPDIGADEKLRARALEAVLRVGGELRAIDPLFAGMSQQDAVTFATAVVEDPRMPELSRYAAISALGALGNAKDEALAATIAKGSRHPNHFVRQQVAVELGRTFSKAAAPFLIDLLKDDSSSVRDAANKSLEQIAAYLDAREKWQGRIK